LKLLPCLDTKEVDTSFYDTHLDAGQPIYVYCAGKEAKICKRELETGKEERTCGLVTLALDYEEEWYESDEIPDLGEYSESDEENDDEDDDNEDLDEISEEDQRANGSFDRPFTFLLERQYQVRHFSKPGIDWEDDVLIFPENPEWHQMDFYDEISLKAYTAYKGMAQKVHPIPGVVPKEARVRRSLPHKPLDTLPQLSPTPPNFIPTDHLTTNFLWPEEEKGFEVE
jgi:hypothetical protein